MILTDDEKTGILADIIQEIQSHSSNGKWFIEANTLADALGISKTDYQREMYKLRDRVQYNTGIYDGFSEKDGELLCMLVADILKIDNIDQHFAWGGIYFNESWQGKLKTYFIDYTSNLFENHSIDTELLSLLASSTLRFEDASDSYIDEKFDIDTLITRCSNAFCEYYGIETDHGAEIFLAASLGELFKAGILTTKKITAPLADRLYYSHFGHHRRKKIPAKPGRNDRLLKFFAVKPDATAEDLKKRYREMLKEFHPDVNRNGLEMTKKIIAHYRELIKVI